MNEIAITFTINGRPVSLKTTPTRTLLQVLREDLELTGTKDGCSQGDCGVCVVVMDGKAVNSCLVFAPQAQNCEIVTVEGLRENGKLHPLQKWFAEKWAFQCGFCTPGMLMSAYALLLQNPDPTEEEVKTAIEGNLCRCTGYRPIVDAVLQASEEMQNS